MKTIQDICNLESIGYQEYQSILNVIGTLRKDSRSYILRQIDAMAMVDNLSSHYREDVVHNPHAEYLTSINLLDAEGCWISDDEYFENYFNEKMW